MYHPSLSVFMTNKTPSGVEKHYESTQPESSRTPKMFFLLLIHVATAGRTLLGHVEISVKWGFSQSYSTGNFK